MLFVIIGIDSVELELSFTTITTPITTAATTGPYGINFLRPQVTSVCNKTRVFVPGKSFQPIVIFVSKAVTYTSEAPFKCSPLM